VRHRDVLISGCWERKKLGVFGSEMSERFKTLPSLSRGRVIKSYGKGEALIWGSEETVTTSFFRAGVHTLTSKWRSSYSESVEDEVEELVKAPRSEKKKGRGGGGNWKFHSPRLKKKRGEENR